MQNVKSVIVGDSRVGKSYLLYTYVNKVFPRDYVPCFYGTYSTEVPVDNQQVSLTLCDSASRDDYEHFRQLSYNQADVIIICFSIANPTSYENVKRKWYPEVKRHCPNVPFVLVGTKRDLRDDQEVLETLKKQNQTTVTQQEGVTMANQIQAAKYLECASSNQEGLNEVIDEAVRAFLSHSVTTEKTCILINALISLTLEMFIWIMLLSDFFNKLRGKIPTNSCKKQTYLQLYECFVDKI